MANGITRFSPGMLQPDGSIGPAMSRTTPVVPRPAIMANAMPFSPSYGVDPATLPSAVRQPAAPAATPAAPAMAQRPAGLLGGGTTDYRSLLSDANRQAREQGLFAMLMGLGRPVPRGESRLMGALQMGQQARQAAQRSALGGIEAQMKLEEMERQRAMAGRQFVPLTAEEKTRLGIPPETFAQRDVMTGEVDLSGRSGGVNVTVGGAEAIQPGLESAGKTIFEQDIEGANQARTALGNIAKTDEVLRLLNEGEPVTGLTAPVQDVVNNARAMLGDEEAIKKASDTGLLNALLGQEVFGSITALGIGARGLDTPAEREFLREVMAGTITMNEETIRKIAELRRKYATEVVEKYNERVEAGDYDMLNQTFGNRYQKIDIPDKPELMVKPIEQEEQEEQVPAGVDPADWAEMTEAERALFR